MNPSAKIPVLAIEPGRYPAESNAILWFLADGTPPCRAEVLRAGHNTLQVMEASLSRAPSWSPSDIRSPTSRSMPTRTWPDAAGIDLTPYAGIRAWLRRVAAQLNHIPITGPVG